MHNYDVFVNDEYVGTLKAWSTREAESTASFVYGAYGTVRVHYITEQQAWMRVQEWLL